MPQLAAACLAFSATAYAEPTLSTPNAATPTPVDALGDDLARAFSGSSFVFYGGAVVVTGAMAFGGMDQAIRTAVQRNLALPAYADTSFYAGYILPLVIAPTVYLAGLTTHDPTATGAGSAALQALAVAVATTSVLKLAAGRAYPLNGGDPHSPSRLDHPEFAREFHPLQRLDLPWLPAWPSGHTSACISVAASLTGYYSERIWIPLVGYPVAIAIGLGMVDGDRHWASDVVAGVLIGHAIGYSIGKAFRTRIVDRSTARAPELTVVPLAGAAYGLSAVGSW